MMKKYPMTLTGKKNLEKELDYLKKEKQKEINDEISIKTPFGEIRVKILNIY